MRKFALPGAIILIFVLVAAMAALGPQAPAAGRLAAYDWVQGFIDGAFVARLGRTGAGVLIFALGLALALVLRRRAEPAAAAMPPKIKIGPRRKPDAETEQAEAEAEAAASRRIAAMRERSQGEDQAPVDPGAVLVLRRARQGNPAGWQEARSWLGGLPRLGGQPWPQGRLSANPLPFAAQIDLADLAAVRPGSGLPQTGSLAFFLGEGAVVYVPEAPDGGRHPLFPQHPPGLAVRDGDEAFPPDPSPEAAGTWPWWPVELAALDLPPHLHDHRNERAMAAIDTALREEEHRRARHREGPLDAALLCRDIGIDPVPLWWHSVGLFAAGLRRARFHAGQFAEGDTPLAADVLDLLDTAIAAMAYFTEGRADTDQLSAAERADFATLFAEISEHCGQLLYGFVPADMADLASGTVRAFASGPLEDLAALPPAMAARIDRDYRQPLACAHRMFGLGAGAGEALWQHINDVLLLQLCSDDMMEWHFGETGVFQFWIAPRDLAEGWLDRAELTFEPA